MKLKKHKIVFINRKHLLVPLFILLYSFAAQGQQLRYEFVNAAGFIDSDSSSLRWTIGESITTEITGPTSTLRVGFLAFSPLFETTSTRFTLNEDINISVYPNPTSDWINVKIPQDHLMNFAIMDASGRTFSRGSFTKQMSQNIGNLAQGTYVIQVIDPKGTFNTQTFIKL